MIRPSVWQRQYTKGVGRLGSALCVATSFVCRCQKKREASNRSGFFIFRDQEWLSSQTRQSDLCARFRHPLINFIATTA